MADQKKAPTRTRKVAAKEASTTSKVVARTAARSSAKTGPRAKALPQAPAEAAVEAIAIEAVVAPVTRMMAVGAEQAREAFERAKAASEQFRQAATESATATTTGAIEINGKVFEAWRAQSEAALDLWRQTLAADSVAEAVRLQTSGARQAYEQATAHWKDLADAATRWLGATVKPMGAALRDGTR